MEKKGEKKVANTIGSISSSSIHASIARKGGTPSVSQIVSFDNEEVPQYLKWLEKFEEKSRSVNLMIG